jgi:hypothetical protein
MKKIKATPTLAKVKVETVLVLRTCAADGSSSHGFKWPESGPVEATDWKPTEECGNGLHGWLWGHGDWSLKAKAEKIKWLVLEVDKSSLIDLCGKVKFPKANVVASFLAWNDAMVFIRARHVTGATTIATGNYGHASATGDYGHASATGNYGHASATGNYGHASATGCSGWAIGGYYSRVKADNNGVLTALWWSDKDQRPRVAVAYVGENGIKADAWYGVDAKGEFLEVKE